MTITRYSGAPETMRIGPNRNKATLAGMNFKTINLGLFKFIRSYWLLNEVQNDKVVGYHTVLFEVEIKPFWRK